jgi:hypothetical protein
MVTLNSEINLRCRTTKLSSRGNRGDAKLWQINFRCRGPLQRLVRHACL